jgi:glycosyltransferase 2 family protein
VLRMKPILITALKLALAATLIAWLVGSGKIDLSQMRLFVTDPELLTAAVSYWLIAACGMGTWRWKTLLEGAGYKITWKRAFQLQVTGFFFNTVMPGAVGGDIIKLAYVIRDNKEKSKTQAMMTVLLDRIVGLSGLFLIGWIFMLGSLSELVKDPTLLPLVTMMGAISLGFAVFYTAALYHYRGRDPFLRFLSLPIPGIGLFYKLYNALRTYRYARGAIAQSIFLSLAIQSLSLCFFYLVTVKILGDAPDFARIASIFPIGVLTTAVPVTPGGLGVGHVAFDKLFNMIGLNHGATDFNLYIISQLLMNLLGVIPYISLRRHQPLPMNESEVDSSSVITAY